MSNVLSFILGPLLGLVSAAGIVLAFLISARQNALTARAIRAQSFVNLLDLEIQSGFQRGMLTIASLNKYTSFEEFDQHETVESKESIYNAVVFLNFMAVLGEEGYLHIQDAWDVYFWSYRVCAEKLLPWWLAEQRRYQPNVFPSFERACAVTSLVSPEQIVDFDRHIGQKHLKKYRKTSSVQTAKLRKALARQIPARSS
ncbi:MAG TPA: hypothetical protein VJQ45_02950 [Ktedonobacterales bacterium]|nr:hypothetical protein [Ktedonobacterales bacterium]